jgi:photosystem II stability/assembly factor-like uncharacterized protein
LFVQQRVLHGDAHAQSARALTLCGIGQECMLDGERSRLEARIVVCDLLVGIEHGPHGTLTSFQTTLQGRYIVDPLHALAVDKNTGTMYRTSDGGQSWRQIASVGLVTSMSFVDSQQGWLISQNGFQRTTNGGNTWRYIPYYYPH